MSGLTLGLMSLSLVDLEVLAKSGTPCDRKNAGIISFYCAFYIFIADTVYFNECYWMFIDDK